MNYFRYIPKDGKDDNIIGDGIFELYNTYRLGNIETDVNIYSSGIKARFVLLLNALENSLNPTLAGQYIYEGPHPRIEVNSPFNTEFYVTDSQSIHNRYIEKGYTPIPALVAALGKHVKALYKDKHLIVFSNEYINWDELYKLLAFRYELMKQVFKEEEVYLDQRFSELYRAFVNKDLDTVNRLFTNILESRELKKSIFDRFKSYFKPRKMKKLKILADERDRLDQNIRELLNEYQNALVALENVHERYEQLITKKEEDISEECINYLVKTPYVKQLYQESSETLNLYYEAPILYYDEKPLNTLLSATGNATRLKIFNIFKEKKYTLYTRCKVAFNTNNFRIYPVQIGGNNQFIGHPHLDRYRCVGNHPDEIQEWLNTGDYIGALTQLSAAVLNLNFYDGIVIDTMCKTIMHNPHIPTFKDNETGEFVSFNTILEKERT